MSVFQMRLSWLVFALATIGLVGCFGQEPAGIAPASPAATTVVMDFFHRPLPEIPLPNDVATRFDPASATGRRINASMLAPTRFERQTRTLMDDLDGWGLFQTITIPFSGPLDVGSILAGHRDVDYDLSNDVVYLINVDRNSPELGKIHHLDLGNGNYPVILEQTDNYWKNDPRSENISLIFEEIDEDDNGNGTMDPGEDTDGDGVLDKPNYLPDRYLPNKKAPDWSDLAGRADALMTFYERETHTLIMRPMMPLEERTTYAVVVTRRLKDESGKPVGSPYPYINHASQNEALTALDQVLPGELNMDDVAFAFTFTTESVDSYWKAVRDGIYGHGVQAKLAQDFPAKLATLLKIRDPKVFTNMKNPHVLYMEQLAPVLKKIAPMFLGASENSVMFDLLMDTTRYVDFFMAGSFNAPQLFPRRVDDNDPKSKLLGLNLQTWPPDLDRLPAAARSEEIHFWISVPRKEISDRGKGKPAPILIFGHGYQGNRVSTLALAGLFAQRGIAVLSLDFPSHGMGVSDIELALAKALAQPEGLAPFLEAMLKDRALDQNGDKKKDSGADFLTAYAFHTRDMFRQSVLDHMQLVKLLRSFDGKRRWAWDVDGDGAKELAGDFDGDGQLDIGGNAEIQMAGGSLGGMMTMLVASLEPEIRVAAPIAGAAGLGDIGIRSKHDGVPEAFVLRLLSPLYVGTLDSKTGSMTLETIVPDLNNYTTKHLSTVTGVKAGDTVLVENLTSKSSGCGYVSDKGKMRQSVEGDLGDKIRITFFAGNKAIVGKGCKMDPAAKAITTVDTFEKTVYFQDMKYESDSQLVALAEGMGYQRCTPSFRRFSYLAGMVLDPGDMVSQLKHLQLKPMTYPGTKQTTGASVVMVTTVGDMSVPTAAGITAGRAAGLIDFLNIDPRYGKPVNQVLIDTYTSEGVHNLKRYRSASKGTGVHMDVENFSNGKDLWAADIPRLNPPLRIGIGKTDSRGGASAALFAYAHQEGMHVFDEPGKVIDQVRKSCKDKCTKTTGDDPCGCNKLTAFDPALFFINQLASYMESSGKKISVAPCNATNTCADKMPPPPVRDKTKLP